MARASGPPGRDCPRCPRLVTFRKSWRKQEPEWFNAPVDSFGPSNARLLIVGLAPGLRGANRTGRPFTGDYAGDLLYSTLLQFGFAQGQYQARPDDGLRLIDCRITNAVRCVPPENKPTPQEITTCREFLAPTIADMPRLSAVLALGRIAHDSVVVAQGARRSAYPFAHGGVHRIGAFKLFNSYHCSRLNTNTGVLTPKMFSDLIGKIRAELDAQTAALT
jgi:uracil-DNA glycosylase